MSAALRLVRLVYMASDPKFPASPYASGGGPPPEPKPTVGIAPPPQWAIEMMTAMKGGFAANSERMDQFGQHLTDQDLALEKVVTAGIDTNVRLDRVEVQARRNEIRIESLENRAGSTSLRIRGQSETDLEQAAQLAQERAAREELAARVATIDTKTDVQTALLNKLVGLTEKPVVKLVATAVGTAILSWLTMKGFR